MHMHLQDIAYILFQRAISGNAQVPPKLDRAYGVQLVNYSPVFAKRIKNAEAEVNPLRKFYYANDDCDDTRGLKASWALARKEFADAHASLIGAIILDKTSPSPVSATSLSDTINIYVMRMARYEKEAYRFLVGMQKNALEINAKYIVREPVINQNITEPVSTALNGQGRFPLKIRYHMQALGIWNAPSG